MTVADRLRSLAEALPAGGAVVLSRDDLLDLAGPGEPAHTSSQVAVDHTVAQLAQRFGKSENTVRDWIKYRGLGAYLFNGREYRIPHAALEEWLTRQREGRTSKQTDRASVDLGAWRKHVRA